MAKVACHIHLCLCWLHSSPRVAYMQAAAQLVPMAWALPGLALHYMSSYSPVAPYAPPPTPHSATAHAFYPLNLRRCLCNTKLLHQQYSSPPPPHHAVSMQQTKQTICRLPFCVHGNLPSSRKTDSKGLSYNHALLAITLLHLST